MRIGRGVGREWRERGWIEGVNREIREVVDRRERGTKGGGGVEMRERDERGVDRDERGVR